MAGSRVLFLIDGNPLLTGNMGQIPWDLIPMENIEEIEIIKGAASAIYGSSALNGVVNIKTKSANQKEIDKHNDSLTDQSENMEEIIFEDTEEAETE